MEIVNSIIYGPELGINYSVGIILRPHSAGADRMVDSPRLLSDEASPVFF